MGLTSSIDHLQSGAAARLDFLLSGDKDSDSSQSSSLIDLSDHTLSRRSLLTASSHLAPIRLLDCSDNDPLASNALLVAYRESGEDEPAPQNKPEKGQPVAQDVPDLPPSRRAREAREAGDLIGEEEALRELLKRELAKEKRDEIVAAQTRHSLAACLEQQGLIAEARKELEAAIAGVEKVTDKHPLKKPVLGLFLAEGASFVMREATDLGKAGMKEDAAKKISEAEKMYVRSIELLDSVENATLKKFFEPGTATVYKDYAWLLEKSGQKEKAAQYAEKAGKMSCDMLGQAEFNKALGEEMRKAGLLPQKDPVQEMKNLHKELGDLEKQARRPLTDKEKQQLIDQLNRHVLQLERIRLGLPGNATPAQIKKAIRDEVGLPESASESDVSRAQRAKSLGLNPLKATDADIRTAEEKSHFELMCKLYKLDPQKATKDDLKQAQDRSHFETMCKAYKLDPQKATKDDIKKAQEKAELEFWCRELKLDPAKTTREQVQKVIEFRNNCYLYKINPEAKDAAEQLHKHRCKTYGLPENATPEQLDRKVKEEQEKWKKGIEERRLNGFDFEPRQYMNPIYDR